MKVLVAEDDRITRLMLQKILEKWGYTVIPVVSGKDAWEALTGTQDIRLAILDWMMPGMEGIEICRRLKQGLKGRLVYTIIVTAKDDRESLATALDAGAHDFLSKPFDPNELRSRLAVGARIIEYDDSLRSGSVAEEGLAKDPWKSSGPADPKRAGFLLPDSAAKENGNPTTILANHLGKLEGFCSDLGRILEGCTECAPGHRKKMTRILKEMPRELSAIKKLSFRMIGLPQESHGPGAGALPAAAKKGRRITP